MKITDCSFTNSDTEYNLIKEFLLEVETYPDFDDNWAPGRMDWWRYNVHSEKGVDFLYESLNPASVKRAYRYSLSLEK